MQERVKKAFPEQKVFEMRPEEMSREGGRGKSPAENSCARPWLGGKQGP